MIIAFGKNERLAVEIARAIQERVNEQLAEFQRIGELTDKIAALKQQVQDLEIGQDREREKYQRTEREIEHKVGLHKRQVKHEITQARERAVLEVEQKNLNAERKRFENEMQFTRDRFSEEVKYLKDMVNQVLKRLPSAEILAEIGSNRPDVR